MHGTKRPRLGEGPVEEVSLEKVTSAMKKIKLGKTSGLEIGMEMINSSGKVGIDVMMKLFQRVFDGKGMSEDWMTSVMVPMYKGKGDVMNCGGYRGVTLFERGMKIIERVLKKRIRGLLVVDDMQFGFMPERGTTNALFILRRMQNKYREKNKKLYMCFVHLKKVFDRISKRVIQWAMRKKRLLTS